MSLINIAYHNPPIPSRDFDYCATFNGYEPGDSAGFGATAKAATEALLSQADDQLLADLGIHIIPSSKFNDDDIYNYNPETLELLHVGGPHSTTHPEGAIWQRGLSAKYVGLWRRVAA